MKNLFLLFIVVFIITACKTESSDDVVVSAIWQSYLYKYNKNLNQTLACAQFRDGGALGNDVILNSPSSISINGYVMVHQNLPYYLYYHYYKEYAGEVLLGTYLFTDKNSKTYTNLADLSTLPPIDFPANLDTISKSVDLVINWTGSAVGTNETIELTIAADSTLTESVNTFGATSITISKLRLATLQNGNMEIILERKRDDNLQASTGKGGNIALIYSIGKACVLKD